jgi:transmembrane sensor
MTGPDDIAAEALAREAANWFAKMRGPDATARQGDFEAWLARGPEHRAAYNRAGEVFALGKFLSEEPTAVPTRRAKPWRAPLATAMASLFAAGIWFGVQHHDAAPTGLQAPPGTLVRMLATEAGEERLVRLEDGSTVRLTGASRVSVRYGPAKRVLTLLLGSARFDVQHDGRPFIVLAGGGSVTARGTLFDVTLKRADHVEVRLLRGAIDVQLPGADRGGIAPVRRLEAGESIAYLVPVPPSGATRDPGLAAAGLARMGGAEIRDLDSVPVRLLLAEVNRDAARPIRLADARIGDERISGRLRVDDTARLAHQLSVVFGWSIDTHDPREIVLKP